MNKEREWNENFEHNSMLKCSKIKEKTERNFARENFFLSLRKNFQSQTMQLKFAEASIYGGIWRLGFVAVSL